MIDDIKAIFSKNLNVLMNRMGANVSDVSEKTGIPYSTVNDWKNGKKMPRGGNLQKLSAVFPCKSIRFNFGVFSKKYHSSNAG